MDRYFSTVLLHLLNVRGTRPRQLCPRAVDMFDGMSAVSIASTNSLGEQVRIDLEQLNEPLQRRMQVARVVGLLFAHHLVSNA